MEITVVDSVNEPEGPVVADGHLHRDNVREDENAVAGPADEAAEAADAAAIVERAERSMLRYNKPRVYYNVLFVFCFGSFIFMGLFGLNPAVQKSNANDKKQINTLLSSNFGYMMYNQCHFYDRALYYNKILYNVTIAQDAVTYYEVNYACVSCNKCDECATLLGQITPCYYKSRQIKLTAVYKKITIRIDELKQRVSSRELLLALYWIIGICSFVILGVATYRYLY